MICFCDPQAALCNSLGFALQKRGLTNEEVLRPKFGQPDLKTHFDAGPLAETFIRVGKLSMRTLQDPPTSIRATHAAFLLSSRAMSASVHLLWVVKLKHSPASLHLSILHLQQECTYKYDTTGEVYLPEVRRRLHDLALQLAMWPDGTSGADTIYRKRLGYLRLRQTCRGLFSAILMP